MKEKIDSINAEEDKKDKEFIAIMEKKNFSSRLSPYNKPLINIILGVFVSAI